MTSNVATKPVNRFVSQLSAPVIKRVNAALAYDAATATALARLDGDSLTVKLVDVPATALSIRLGFPLELAAGEPGGRNAGLQVTPLQLLSGRYSTADFSGDESLVLALNELLANTDIQWKQMLSSGSSAEIASLAGAAGGGLVSWLSDMGRRAGHDLAAFLQDERQVLPHLRQIRHWSEDVDQAVRDLERLESRLERLTNSATEDQ